jgi:hypothetical protein
MHTKGVGVKRDWILALKWLKKAAEKNDERALGCLKENGIEFTPGQEAQRQHRLTADQPLFKNPAFDVTLITGEWVTKIDDPEMEVSTVYQADGTFHAEGRSETLETWHYSGRWAVEGDKLLWDVHESDMPFPLDGDMDDVVLSISASEMVTKDAEEKISTYRRKVAEGELRPHEPVEKVVRLVSRNGDKAGA